MIVIKTISLLRQSIYCWRQKNKSIALVATMGNLHEGHMKLVDNARSRANIVIVSIFINPLQFDHPDDLARYPRTFEEDCKKLMKYDVDILFYPEMTEIYPHELSEQTTVYVPRISNILEGASRHGHFRGVSTIISKLFNLVQPDLACFGEKDYQQLVLIRKMVADMGYDIDIVGVPTVRNKYGLALSSRNRHLTSEEYKIAPKLNKIMNILVEQFINGESYMDELLEQTGDKLRSSGFIPDGVFIRDADTLHHLTPNSQRAVVLIAAWLGKTRLIDSHQFDFRLCKNISKIRNIISQ